VANIEKCVLTWTGFTGAPGYTVLYFKAGSANSSQSALKTFIVTVAQYIPSAITISFPAGGDVIDEATGKAVNTWSTTQQSAAVGTAATTWVSMAGAQTRWETGAFANGHRVRGRTFWVPLAIGNFTQGLVTAACANGINSAATSYLGGISFAQLVWHRPVYDHSVKPPVLTRPGLGYPVASAVTPTKAVYLSERRD
jgi:hypothetical protein